MTTLSLVNVGFSIVSAIILFLAYVVFFQKRQQVMAGGGFVRGIVSCAFGLTALASGVFI
jgi:hypothetical protein